MYIEKYNNQYRKYVNFIKKYRTASNAASGSEVDANANVENKNIATCSEELCKREKIGCNRLLMVDKITEMFGADLAEEYLRQLEAHEIYKHDETSIFPYTYSSKEAVTVLVDGKIKLISLEDLYDFCDEDEVLLDEEKLVFGKFPKHILIKDKGGNFTEVLRLIKKKRHRDLVCVKTKNGENLIVTDNHPMIVGETKEDVVPAIDSLGMRQTKIVENVETNETTYSIQLPFTEKYQNFVVNKVRSANQSSFEECQLDNDFGYFVGFFIAEGWFVKSKGEEYDSLVIKQKGRDALRQCVDSLYASTGIRANISELRDERGFYCLRVCNQGLVDLLLNEFKISPTAQNKKLPIDILSYPEDFQYGLVCGLVDGDGTVTEKGQASIRLSSRTAISQLSQLLVSLGIGCSMTYYDGTLYSGDKLIQDSYPMFGVTFWLTDDMYMANKYRADTSKFHKYETETAEIIKVTKITNEKFLSENDFIYDITTKSNTFAMNNIWVHNCVSITMYPFLFNGMKGIGGLSNAPKNLESFIGGFINLVFAIASQFAGAVSTPEFLLYMDYFLRKDYGDDYWDHWNEPVTAPFVVRQRTMQQFIQDKWQQVIYSINQPAAARGYQAVFWNIAYFDKPYFEGMFSDFVFPDGSSPRWETLSRLQKEFMKWFNKERTKTVLTFPVETMNLLNNKSGFVDKDMADFTAEMYSEGHSFFTYTSDSVDSLASCCRLRNEMQENTFSYTLGAGGVSTGSKGVMTININRLVQNVAKRNENVTADDISTAVKEQVDKIHKYLLAFNEIIKDSFNSRMLPIYDAGYISLEKQYLTIGINGFPEGAEFLGIKPEASDEYFKYGEMILKPIYESNRAARTDEVMFNTEFVPAENLGVKNAKWDKEDGYLVPRDCYNSYFYLVEDESCNLVEKLTLHGRNFTKYLDGGSALHANLSEHLTKDQYKKVLQNAVLTGCSYLTFNVPNTVCNDCGYISKHALDECPHCGSKNLDFVTRIIGYLKRISRFSEPRQKEAAKRFYE